MFVFVVLALVSLLPFCFGQVAVGSLQKVSGFPNPTNAGFHIYVPRRLAAQPGIVVAVHMCQSNGQSYANMTPYKQYAEQYGFIAIYPTAPSGSCWDVSSRQTLRHDGGGDSTAIANMVRWTMQKYPVDEKKVFVTGSSSGAMMTNVLAATYPDIFSAGVVYSGVPAGCFMSSSGQVNGWNSTCSQGRVNATPQVWAGMAFDMYPGYRGSRPKMQIYHGSADTTLSSNNYAETIKQWCGVFGYDYNRPVKTLQNSPRAGYMASMWGPSLEGYWAQGLGHNVPIMGDRDMEWFGFA